jgi:hypothetical protein
MININALNPITVKGMSPHPPLSPAGRGEGEGGQKLCLTFITSSIEFG